MKRKGFTLVELIVVIAVLVILVGLLAPNVLRYIEKSRKAKDIAALDTAYQAIMLTLADEAANDALVQELTKDNIFGYVSKLVDGTDLGIGKDSAFRKEFLKTYGTTAYQPKSKAYADYPMRYMVLITEKTGGGIGGHTPSDVKGYKVYVGYISDDKESWVPGVPSYD
ncbi:prepilin-type N-terminal cleavage/methylation domain-containing protein [Anaerolentibacter hominis]|uniref:prepilin-type N-terminal cleavage/methylation domain-containing protein n=1 Tax=Anaerolentibacter hominis TaxID=3079009 RepID=UPI0031B8AB55